jgi:FkbM family methyltransferase
MSKTIDLKNEGALALRNVYQKHRNLFMEQASAFSLSKAAPYFGYIDVEIYGLEKVCMFSNNDDFVAKEYFWKGSNAYEPMSIRVWLSLAKSSAVIFDIGAYTGLYSLAAAILNRKAKVYAFEALDVVYSRLLVNIQVNSLGNIKAYNLAVSNEEGSAEFNVYAGDTVLSTGSTLVDGIKNKELFQKKHVRAARLDDLVNELSVPRLDLMKIDTEGAEHLVIQGGQGALKKHTPDIILEVLGGARVDQINSVLSGIGYRFYHIDEAAMSIRQIDSITSSVNPDNLNTLVTMKSPEEINQLITGVP